MPQRPTPTPHAPRPTALCLHLTACALLLVLTACNSQPEASESDGPRYAVTLPPLAMIVEPVVEGRGTVVTLLDPGDSPHTHDPRPSDLRAVQGSRALLFGAPMLDGWAADLPSDRRWALLDVVPATYRRAFGEDGLHASTASDGDANDEEAHSGKTHDGDAHDRDAHDGDAHGEHGPGSVDPHFWTDPLAVKALLPALVDSLCAADAEGCPVYRANADSFATDLEALDARLETMLRPVRHEPVMLAQPFFHYFAARYGPAVVAVVEPQPAKEPSPRQIQRLVRRAEADRVQAVFTQHQLPPRAAEVVAESASLPIHTLDPLGGTPGRRDYDALLLHNASVILSALQDG